MDNNIQIIDRILHNVRIGLIILIWLALIICFMFMFSDNIMLLIFGHYIMDSIILLSILISNLYFFYKCFITFY
jgi:hypothetical protein